MRERHQIHSNVDLTTKYLNHKFFMSWHGKIYEAVYSILIIIYIFHKTTTTRFISDVSNVAVYSILFCFLTKNRKMRIVRFIRKDGFFSSSLKNPRSIFVVHVIVIFYWKVTSLVSACKSANSHDLHRVLTDLHWNNLMLPHRQCHEEKQIAVRTRICFLHYNTPPIRTWQKHPQMPALLTYAETFPCA